jgi:hypothetical protein
MTGNAASVNSTTFKNTNAGPNSVNHQSLEYQVRDEHCSGICVCIGCSEFIEDMSIKQGTGDQ